MYSILLKMPKPNYLLLKELIHVLSKIKTSTENHLDSYVLSVRIAPYVLWDTADIYLLFGWDLYQKVSKSNFSLWEQSLHCDLGIENTLERSLMLKDTLVLHSSVVGDALIYFINLI